MSKVIKRIRGNITNPSITGDDIMFQQNKPVVLNTIYNWLLYVNCLYIKMESRKLSELKCRKYILVREERVIIIKNNKERSRNQG